MGNPSLAYGYRQFYDATVSVVCATASYTIGTTRFDNGREWIYVYQGGADDVSPGYAVRLASGSTGYTVNADGIPDPSTVSAGCAFGVVQNATLLAANYGWVCRRGFGQVMADGNTSIAKGWHLHVTVSGCVDRATAATGNYTTMTRQFYACEDQDTTTTGSFTAYINCMNAV
jgi:hypothetical protein